MRWILAVFCLVNGYGLFANPVCIHVQERRDYEVLDLFFKMTILEEEYGYVLNGVKPLSIRQFYPLDVFPMRDLEVSENEFKKTVLVRELFKYGTSCVRSKIDLPSRPSLSSKRKIGSAGSKCNLSICPN